MYLRQRLPIDGTADVQLDTSAVEFGVFYRVVGVGKTCDYVITSQDRVDYEIGEGQMAEGGVWDRTTVTESSNGNALVDFDEGSHSVFIEEQAATAAVAYTDATITLAYSGLQSDAVAVVDAAISAGSKIVVNWGTVADTDVNGPEDDPVSFTVTPGAGTMTVRVSSSSPAGVVGGPYKIRYLIG